MGKKKGVLGDLESSVAAGARQAAGLRISQTAELPDFHKLPPPPQAGRRMVREKENNPARSSYENAALIPEVRREIPDWFDVKG